MRGQNVPVQIVFLHGWSRTVGEESSGMRCWIRASEANFDEVFIMFGRCLVFLNPWCMRQGSNFQGNLGGHYRQRTSELVTLSRSVRQSQ